VLPEVYVYMHITMTVWHAYP